MRRGFSWRGHPNRKVVGPVLLAVGGHPTSHMRTITLEEHFVTKSFLKATDAFWSSTNPRLGRDAAQAARHWNGPYRPRWTRQVLTFRCFRLRPWASMTSTPIRRLRSPRTSTMKSRRRCLRIPGASAAFASLALQDPDAAAEELERCVTKLGFVGTMLDGTTEGLLSGRQELHARLRSRRAPWRAYLPASRASTGGRSRGVLLRPRVSLANCSRSRAGGWHAGDGPAYAEAHRLRPLRPLPGAATHHRPHGRGPAVRAGALERRPLSRRDACASQWREYFKTNIHLTTSGYFTQPPLQVRFGRRRD